MLDHVSYIVSPKDAEACAGFYSILGFGRIEPPDALKQRAIWLRLGDTSIHLVFRDSDGVDVVRSLPGAGHVAYVIEQYEMVVGALESAGQKVDHRTEYWGKPRCLVADPAGNSIELMAAPPAP
ncbi:MAG: VOC family protein [Solirubrobacterales bacterium]